MTKQAGFSLLELLLVLTISSLFLFSLYQLFFHQQQQYVDQQVLLQSQENSRLAAHLLKNQMQFAGEAGCGSLANLILVDHISHHPRAIYEKNNKIYIEKASYERANLSQVMMDIFDPIYIQQEDLFAEDDIVLISDCTYADLFQIKQIKNNVQGQILYHTGLSRTYTQNAQIMRWQVDSFYVTTHKTAQDKFTLFQKTVLPDKPAIELVEKLDDWQVQYALLANNSPQFLSAEEVQQWADVRGIIINHFNIIFYNAQ
ncbi:MAG: prepilin-type N-terminal cleavage/methylation domain-containing protein [Gammaproteobacteria bacterium]